MSKITHIKLIEEIKHIEPSDENIESLQKTAENYCSTWDLCEGYKYALIMTLEDQYENHPEDQESGDLEKLSKMLNIE